MEELDASDGERKGKGRARGRSAWDSDSESSEYAPEPKTVDYQVRPKLSRRLFAF